MTKLKEDMITLRPTEAYEELHKKELQFYLFGLHIGKSKAPLILNSAFESLGLKWRYHLKETDSKDVFNQQLEEENCIGAAVTMPNKVNFISEIDLLDNVGAGVSSINCVYTRKTSEGKIIKVGTNTDTIGIQESFLNTKEALPFLEKAKGKAGLIYGGGGASRSAVYALIKLLGCSHVYIVNRDEQEVEQLKGSMSHSIPSEIIIHIKTPEMAKEVDTPSLAVLCVPNFDPVTEAEIQAKETLKVFMESIPGAVLEMCYHPVIYTTLYHEFKKAGWIVIEGFYAVVYQGMAQISLWTGLPIEDLPVEKALEAVLKDIENSK